MLKKALVSITILAMVLALASVSVVGAKGPGPGGGGGGGGGKGGGGGGEVPDTGTLYGDLYVVLRDVDGVPIFDANGCIQPIAAEDAVGEVVIYDSTDPEEVLFETTAIPGEPFALAFYTDEALELEVECELTEEMADWVMTVDFGRLNMGRAPVSVIAHAFDEAINKMNAATEISLDPAGRLVLTLPDEETEDPVDTVEKTIDAPAENLALYIAMMTDGDWYTEDTTPIVNGGPPDGVGPPEGDGPSSEPRPRLCYELVGIDPTTQAPIYEWKPDVFANLNAVGLGNLCNDRTNADQNLNNQELLQAASLLAAAADKTGSITLDKVVYINFIYGINQLGSLDDGQAEPRNYFDFGGFEYNRGLTYQNRGSTECSGYGPSFVWVLQPEVGVENHFVTTCMDLVTYADPPLGGVYDNNSVRYTYMTETYEFAFDAEGNPVSGFTFDTNVRGFAQAADDALQVIEYIHNYKVPENLYAE